MSKKIKEDKLLTDAELELMNILWQTGEGSVNDVMEQLPEDRELAYTSVSTILRILEQKKIVQARKEGRGHIYIPLVTKENYEERTLKHVVEKVFGGTPLALAKQLINTAELSREDLDELKKLIEKAGKPS